MYQKIISAKVLKENIHCKEWLIVDTRFDLMNPEAGYAAYQQAHLPGAVYANLDKDLSSEIQAQTGRHPLPDPEKLIALLNQWGLQKKSQVIVYDDANGAIAARLWWLLKWLGHQNVAVLDGGLKAWLYHSDDLSSEAPQEKHADSGLDAEKVLHYSALSTNDIQHNLTTKEFIVLDARAPARFRGEVEPIDPHKGHIPNALNFPLSRNLDDNGFFLPAEELRTRYQAVIKNTPIEKVVCMCGSGVTACHNILAMSIAGLDGTKLYAGSWSEWSRDPKRSIATGE